MFNQDLKLRCLSLTFIWIMSLWLCPQVIAQQNNQLTNSSLVKWVDTYMSNTVQFDHFSGAVLLARKGQVFYEKYFGLANRELNVANHRHTKFLIGSVSKQFTAAAIMLLHDKGMLNLDDPIHKYLDSCPSAWQAIKIRHLLNHTSGLINFTSLEEASGKFLMVPHTHEEIVQLAWNKPLESEPGEKFKYNNTGYYLLGIVVEKVSGKKFPEFVHENILSEIGLHNTGFDRETTVLKDRASGYFLSNEKVFYNTYRSDMSNLFAIGGMYSTVRDLLKWQQALFGGRIISKSSLGASLVPIKSNFGFGWVIDSLGSVKRVYHDGGVMSFSSSLHYLPAEDLTIIAISNSGEDGGIRVAYDIAGKVGNHLATIRGMQPELMQQKADVCFAMIKKYREGFPMFDVGESKIEEIGNYLALMKRQKQAVEVFRLNTLLYPSSAQAYYNLASAYYVSGEKELERKNLLKCLELDPLHKEAAKKMSNVVK
jgi:CubicO group peptidase (beta-lactamase class C family)